MADLIEDPKKKKASFGDAAAAAADPGVMQIGGAVRPAPMAMPAAPDIGPFVGKPGDFPVNPDGTPMMKPAAGAIPPALPSVARPPDPIGRTVQINSDGSPALTPDQKQAMANQTAAYVTGAQASAAARPPDAGGINLGAVQPAPTERPPAHSTATLAAPKSDYARQMSEVAGFFGAIPAAAMKWVANAPGGHGVLSSPGAEPPVAMAPNKNAALLTGDRMNAMTDPRSLLNTVRPEQAAVAPAEAVIGQEPAVSPVAPIAAGAVKTQGQMNMEADLKSAEAMKAERLAAEGRAPQAVVTHSGNDWQARNNLRNLEVSASSMTAQPKDLMAYDIARKHDTQLQGGSTAADVANVAAANRNNEINSTAQVANARTAQQGQQFGASHELATQRLALDNRKADIADAGSKMDNATKKQLQDLSAQIMKETDPAKLAVLQDKYQTITGRYQRPDPAARELYKAVTDPVTGKVTMYNTQTGEVGGGQQAPSLPPKESLTKGQTYQTARGPAIWDGSKFNPVK